MTSACSSARFMGFVVVLCGACASQPRQSAVKEAPSAAKTSATSQPGTGEALAQPETTAPAGSQALSLPRLEVETIGLHIGGGPNDAAAKQPFLRAIEAEFESIRHCYRFVEAPGASGVFGVDLYVAREGGNPVLREVRTGMRPEKFRQCVRAAFERIVFEKPAKGPTVISYSVRFSLIGLRN